MSEYNYKTSGTCSVEVKFGLVDGNVSNIEFKGGCSGNARGMASLAEGMDAHELVKKLSGISCGEKSTSCPDQLAKAVLQAMQKNDPSFKNPNQSSEK